MQTKIVLPSLKQVAHKNRKMAANSAVRFLVLWTIVNTLFQLPKIQAQSETILTVSASISPLFGPSSNFLATPSISSTFSSTYGLLTSSADQPIFTTVLSTPSKDGVTTALKPVDVNNISTPAITLPSSSAAQNVSSTTTPPTKGPTTPKLTKTDYILIACLCVFGLVFIAIIILVVQIARLNNSVKNLKATSNK